jgi:16S rRNA processing protein RimM
MERKDCVMIGYTARAHGVQGEIRCVLDVFDIEEYRRVKRLYLGRREGGPLQEWPVRKFKALSGSEALLSLEGCDTREAAEALCGNSLFYPIELLPPLAEGHFYYFQVIGYQVRDELLGPLGTVKDFADGPAHDFLIMESQGQEVIIPLIDEFVLRADMASRSLLTRLPEGLVELYTQKKGGEEEEEA